MWVWVTALGLVVEVGVIVVLGRAAIRRTEQDRPPAPPARTRAPVRVTSRVTTRVTTHVTVPLPALPMPPVIARAAVSPAVHRAAPAARR